MGILFIILIMVVLELIQVLNSRFKIRKWILPIISLLNSINIILSILILEKHDSSNNKIESISLLYNILYFVICNIPTLIFIFTNYILNKKKVTNKKFYNKIGLYTLITLIFIVVLFIIIQISTSKLIVNTNTKNIINAITK